MSIGFLNDYRIRLEPSAQIISFIASLHEYDEMPKNIIKIYNSHNKTKIVKKEFKGHISIEDCTKVELEFLKKFDEEEIKITSSENVINPDTLLNEGEDSTDSKEWKPTNLKIEYIFLDDLKWLQTILEKKRSKDNSKLYLHDLIKGSKLVFPENEIIPRNPELEVRCRKLQLEQNAREYRKMTKDVDPTRKHIPEDTIAFQIKSINRQLIAILQFVFSVLTGFAFGFLGIELIIGNLDFGFRLLLGVIFALIIALAEIYFLAKKLNEFDSITKEADAPFNIIKEHKD